MCDESKARSRELEKLQLKFDADMSVWRNKCESEREAREKCERERDTVKYEIFTLKSELDSHKLESKYLAERSERLERDLKEYETASATTTSNAAPGSASLASAQSTDQFIKMKAHIRDMEAKLKDQEEELDEQSGTIQQLEQAKLRLEMQAEKEKQKWTREVLLLQILYQPA